MPLSPFRALDLTDEKGFLCGKVLGDLGADVVKIEKPGGDSSRRIGPFYRDIPDPEKSLYWFAYNSNKRGITLNIETEDGRKIFKKLVGRADFVIESFSPGYMDKLGLSYSALSQINPGIIMTSISHFGQDGPYRDYKGSDLVDWGMGGYMYLCGDPDRPPVRISFPQAYLHASIDAASVTMIAFHHRQQTGEGQHIDLSIHQSLPRLMMIGRLFWEINNWIQSRGGIFEKRFGVAGLTLRRHIWPCKEGRVTFVVSGGGHAAVTMIPLTEWMDEEGMTDDFLKSLNWTELDMAKMGQDLIDMIEERIGRFFLMHTAQELYEGARQRRFMLYPVSTPKDIAENQQLATREFWQTVEHPELKATITYPGAFLKASETPLNIRYRAPLIGEHNDEVFGELGISRNELITLKEGNII